MKRMLISRTDNIGDVLLTLPMCVWLKDHFIDAQLIYLGKAYTQPIISCFSVIDHFISLEEIEKLPTAQKIAYLNGLQIDVVIHVFPNKEIATLSKKAKIPIRIGTSHRGFHLLTCNQRVNFSRKKSDLHESQLNFELLRPLGLKKIPAFHEVSNDLYAFRIPDLKLPSEIEKHLEGNEKTVILHPLSRGSAVNWPLASYMSLASKLTHKGYKIFFTGTDSEGLTIRKTIPEHPSIIDLTGKLSLTELIFFISRCKNLVACSTGPLHIAGICGIRTIGLFSPRRPIHPGRWSPIGKNIQIVMADENCPWCRKNKTCQCIEQITPDMVMNQLD